MQKQYGYQQVITPHIGMKDLYVTSGHYAKYGKDSFQPIHTPDDSEESVSYTHLRYVTDLYGLEVDQFNDVRPAGELVCEGLRMQIEPRSGHSVGMAEVRIDFVP